MNEVILLMRKVTPRPIIIKNPPKGKRMLLNIKGVPRHGTKQHQPIRHLYNCIMNKIIDN